MERTLALMQIFQNLYEAIGPRHWWPADSAEEVVIGAILVQNVAWTNTVKAIDRLKQCGLLSLCALHDAQVEDVEQCITSTRFYRSKAKKLKAFASHVAHQYDGNLSRMLSQPLEALRKELLGLYGIGPETADAILLYAAEYPSFVVDAYTKRIFHRLGFTAQDISYDAMRNLFMTHLSADPALFNEYHALIDALGHHYCHPRQPECDLCPLSNLCQYPQV